ncbi:cellulose synthase subunit BcsC-related outer membrane protein [Novosphingobium sp.]|uniref:cellulose synthase subunit BcsC-related outer membrane protein n=1 Tax=Novosphingobium sp. TaxID=1874826 RepID=UPI0038BC02B2
MTALTSTRRRALTLALLIASALPTVAAAEAPGYKALIDQANYWRSKGRGDLADEALRRAHALDPSAQAPRRAPEPAADPAPFAAPRQPAPRVARDDAAPAPRARAAASRPAPRADRSGETRQAGFAALDDGDLDAASDRFERAIARNSADGDSLGGLGIVRLRQSRFAEARDYLIKASRYPGADRWTEALATARFFGGLEDARNALSKNNLDQAQQLAEAAARSGYTDSQPALELLAEIYERQGRFADAADLYRQAGETGSGNESRLQSRAARGRALAAVARGDDLSAEQEFQNGMLIDQNDPWIRYEFARFMIRRGRSIEADSLLSSLTGSSDPDSLYAAALISTDMGRPASAEALLDRIPDAARTPPMRTLAISVKTDSAIERAKAMAATGQKADAIASLRQIGALRSLPAARKAAVAGALFDLGDSASASSLAQQALTGDISDLGGYDAVIRVLAKTGRDDLARSALQKATALGSSTPEGQRTLAKMQAGLAVSQADRMRLIGQFAPAFDILRTAWTAAPDNVEVLQALGRLYQSGNMPARAAQTYQLVLARDSRNRDALIGLAETAQQAGDKDLSTKATANALQVFPQDYTVRLALARVAQSRGDKGGAVRLLKEARELYAKQMASAGTGGADGINPFTNTDPMMLGANGLNGGPGAVPGAAVDPNPFRNRPVQPQAAPRQMQPQQAPAVNPFTLGNGTRLPSPSADAVPVSSAYPEPAMPIYADATPVTFAAASSVQVPGVVAMAPQGWASAPAPKPVREAPDQQANAGYPPVGSGYGYGGGTSGDPVMARIQSDIAALDRQKTQASGPQAEFFTGYRSRKGEVGLSQLQEMKATAKLSTGLLGGRVHIKGEGVMLDAGTPNSSGLARFGTNATIEARSIVNKVKSPLVAADNQNKSGVAVSIGYDSQLLHLEAGTTPIGFGKTRATFHAEITPKVSETTTLRAYAERKPVTDTVVSYAGARDPVTGQTWGQVMRTSGGVGFSYDSKGTGLYGDVQYKGFRGNENTRRNRGIEANLGGYTRLTGGEHSSLTAGFNLNYQTYRNQQNFFTFGQGGYFSPKSFFSVSFPVQYSLNTTSLDLKAGLTPGFQSYSQKETLLYPTAEQTVAQANLDNLKVTNSDVRSRYDAASKTGFALSADASAYYKIGAATQIGGEASFNSFGSYDEFRSLIGIRQSFGSTKP